MPPTSSSPIDLRNKTHPSEELPHSISQSRAWWSIYSMDISKEAKPLMDRVLLDGGGGGGDTKGLGRLPDKLKDCGLRRAFHDELGVRKVVFVFCDDMLSTVYRLPSFYAWAEQLHPIFKRAGARPDQIIRCLLAELGPGVDIPVHHDTGYWATRSHRMHVPLITSSLVEFYTGPTENTLTRVPFPQFSLIELNNRAKHMVRNKWDLPRVHLIFDWIEDQDMHGVFTRCDLNPDVDMVTQTRRTIRIVPVTHTDDVPAPPTIVASSPIIDESLQDGPVRKQAIKDLIDSIKRAKNRDNIEAARFVREFQKYSMRYSEGEVTAEEYASFLSRSFPPGELQSVKSMIASLIVDRERANALRNVSRSFPFIYSSYDRCPRFVIVGAMKCGTTSMYEYINRHPMCVPARQKEPHAFDWVWDKLLALPSSTTPTTSPSHQFMYLCEPNEQRPDILTSFALREKYLKAFDIHELVRRGPDSFTGEATPSYLLGGAEIARRIRAAAPSTRLIVMLREPVARAYSQYVMTADVEGIDEERLKRRGNLQDKSFEDVVREDLDELQQCEIDADTTLACEFEASYLSHRPIGHGAHSYVGRGLYALQLECMLHVFPREQIMVVTLEELSKNPARVMERVFDFLGVKQGCVDWNALPFEKHNQRRKANVSDMTSEMKQMLTRYYEKHNARLKRLFPDVNWEGW